MKREIDFSDEELLAAEHWHGGLSSMLYAIVSTGSLTLGMVKPWPEATNDEWFAHIANKLSSEADECVASAQKQLKGKRGKERAELLADIDGLRSISTKAEEAADIAIETK